MKRQAAVIGSGISGLSVSRMLCEEYDVKVLEKCSEIGGLIKCGRVDGNLFHYVGGHVFNSKNSDVLEWFWKHFDRDRDFLRARRNAKIFMNNKFIGYPIENYLYQLPEKELRVIIGELIALHEQGNERPRHYSNFKDFLTGKFGNTLYNLYFGPYNNKVWHTDISKVPLEWLDGKLPMPNTEEVLLNNILRKEEAEMVHSTFYYPKKDGSQFIINRLAEGLNINLSYEVSGISLIGEKLSINSNGKDLTVDMLVYTGDVRNLHSIISINNGQLQEALLAVADLLSNGTSNVLCETDDNDISWLYLPEQKFKAHRIIYTGNFSDSNNQGARRKTCVVEFSGKHDREEMENELRNLPGNLRPLAFNYEPNSYIIHQPDTRSKIKTLKTLLAKYNIYLLGRFAEWEYFNMDKCIESAMALSREVSKTRYKIEKAV